MKQHTKVAIIINKALLRESQSPCLIAQKVSLLHVKNSDQVGGLRILKGFNSIANLSVIEKLFPVESRRSRFAMPTTLRPSVDRLPKVK